jgi:predicted RecB family nuclease
VAKVAEMSVPVTFMPSRGARETYGRIGDQARVQHQQRTEGRPIYERLAIAPDAGLCRLPVPSAGDLFLDIEGARFAREGGREYLFGVYANGAYRCWWATDDATERDAFEKVMDVISDAWARDPAMHVYHFNHYEVSAFKRLMGRYATRAEPLNELLRAGRFVDLYPIARQAIRAGVESYSIKKLELFSGYTRGVETVACPRRLAGRRNGARGQCRERHCGRS